MKITLSEIRQMVRQELRNTKRSRSRRLNESKLSSLDKAFKAAQVDPDQLTGDELSVQELATILQNLSPRDLEMVLSQGDLKNQVESAVLDLGDVQV